MALKTAQRSCEWNTIRAHFRVCCRQLWFWWGFFISRIRNQVL